MIKIYESFLLESKCDKLFSDTKEKCDKHGVKFVTSNDITIKYPIGNSQVSGYFIDYGKPELGIATGGKLEAWSATLAHESSHMDQWLENSKFWINNFIDGKEAIDYIDEWISGKDFSQDELDKFFSAAIGVEHDCEMRSVRKIEEYELPLIKSEEIQKANSYILFYSVIKETRKWYLPGKAPYLIKDVWSKMPKTFDIDYSIVPEDIKELYNKYCLI